MRFFGQKRRSKITILFCIMSNHCDLLRVIRHNRYLDLGKGTNKVRNHWCNLINRDSVTRVKDSTGLESRYLVPLLLRQLFKQLLGRTRSRGRCWAASWLSHRPEPSGYAVHGAVNGLCWVRVASSTWNVSWLWNINKGILQKQVKKAT